MHGLGNNYIYIDLFNYQMDEASMPAVAKAMADVNKGIGSDGMILIHPSTKADVGMRIFNKDGSEGKSCGNGLRCTAKYAFENGIVTKPIFQIETKANIVEAEVFPEEGRVHQVTINMGEPALQRSAIPMLGDKVERVVGEDFLVDDQLFELTAVSMGNPHAVFFVEDINEAPLYEIGPIIEKDQRFPEGVNVEFIQVVSENELYFQVWERGSGVTQACGTGACAAVVAATLNSRVARGEDITVHLQGGDLVINWDKSGQVWMSGEAKTVVTGVFHYVI
ncbi:diaminopimelate epimerase [Oceanobacillus manasiensis]|uniref:diaminopimelate epimerase n=1 Tax=Oceanobacillus manasiensis TaxID=586413 RepID=UPI0005A9E542|nr:diaminopimelate epimerase [Oceanobacillus manasiensis]